MRTVAAYLAAATFTFLPKGTLADRDTNKIGGSLTADENDEAEYKGFRQEYGRSDTDDAVSYEERLQHFLRYRAAVERHNSRKDATWTAAVNQFADYTDAEFKALLGHRRGPGRLSEQASSLMQMGSARAVKAHKARPASLDWSTKLASGQKVKDQGGCGSCWATAAVGALEMHAEKTLGREVEALSANQIKDCSLNPHNCGGTGGCGGSTSELGFNYTAEFGLSSEAAYQGNKNKNEDCKHAEVESYIKTSGYKALPVNEYEPLMEAIYEHGPVVVSIDAAGWSSYQRGIFDSCVRDATVNHAVVLTGYGTAEKDYWLIRNSWGERWGENGFIRLLRHDSDIRDWSAGYCGTDTKPQEGVGCDGGPPSITVCGMCGVLSDSSYPVGLQLWEGHRSDSEGPRWTTKG